MGACSSSTQNGNLKKNSSEKSSDRNGEFNRTKTVAQMLTIAIPDDIGKTSSLPSPLPSWLGRSNPDSATDKAGSGSDKGERSDKVSKSDEKDKTPESEKEEGTYGTQIVAEAPLSPSNIPCFEGTKPSLTPPSSYVRGESSVWDNNEQSDSHGTEAKQKLFVAAPLEAKERQAAGKGRGRLRRLSARERAKPVRQPNMRGHQSVHPQWKHGVSSSSFSLGIPNGSFYNPKRQTSVSYLVKPPQLATIESNVQSNLTMDHLRWQPYMQIMDDVFTESEQKIRRSSEPTTRSKSMLEAEALQTRLGKVLRLWAGEAGLASQLAPSTIATEPSTEVPVSGEIPVSPQMPSEAAPEAELEVDESSKWESPALDAKSAGLGLLSAKHKPKEKSATSSSIDLNGWRKKP